MILDKIIFFDITRRATCTLYSTRTRTCTVQFAIINALLYTNKRVRAQRCTVHVGLVSG